MATPPHSRTFSLVVVSNRLPVVWQEGPGGLVNPVATPGGLVTAMGPVVTAGDAVWVGSSGRSDVPQELRTIDGMTLLPLSLDDDLAGGHYDGFSNQTLWPLCHDVGVDVLQDPNWEVAYLEANRIFATAVAALAAPGALVWVHDYQLMALPAMVRALRPDLTIGYFHHIPFPDPVALEAISNPGLLIEGLLGGDLVGCQIPGDSANFIDAVESRGLGQRTPGGVVTAGRTVTVGAFPISLDFRAVSDAAAEPSVRARAAAIRGELGNPRRVFLGVDRIDYTKGIPERLLAFGGLLDSGALDPNDVVFIQAGSPSREAIVAYQDLQARIGAIVADITARHPRRDGRPVIRYGAENLPREEMLALYCAADVMVVTPLRDGMNLVVKEFVASRSDQGGVVVLGTGAGAALEMPEAILVDPRDPLALSAALLQAVTMEPSEARERMTRLREGVRTHDVHDWAESFLSTLRRHRG